jgi:hypothetical protein
MIYHPGTITLSELFVLYENMLWCNAKSEVDENFKNKFGETLEVITKVLKNNRFGLRVRSIRKLVDALKKENLNGFIFPERNMSGIANQLRDSSYLIDGELGRPNQSLPPKSIIGKGYRDHGCLKDQAWDGSPHWTEVAMAHLDLMESFNET